MRRRLGSRLGLLAATMLLAGLGASPEALGAAGTVAVTGPTLTVLAAPGAKDSLQVSRPSQSRLQVSDFPSGVYAGAPIHAGASCAQTGTKQVSCVATGVKRIQVSSGDRPDRVVNSTAIPSALDGGAANDVLIGGAAADTLTGGPAPDVVRGLGENDQLLLHDGASDESIDCGVGAADYAALDRLPLDPNTAVKGCEAKERGMPGPYVALGDSLSIGFSASSPAKGYVGLLHAGYRSSLGVNQLLDEGQAGASTTTLRNNGQLADALSDINAPSDTKAVTIDVGGYEAYFENDCPSHWDQPNACPVRANLAYILGQLKTALAADPGKERFMAMAYYNPASGKGGSTEASGDTTLLGTNKAVGCADAGSKVGLNDVIYQEAGKLGIGVADPYPAFKQHGQAYMSSTDSLHVHPNDAGYAAIAQAFGSASRICG